MTKSKKTRTNAISRRRFMELGALGSAAMFFPYCDTNYPVITPGIAPEHSQALVIGTGFGGAVAALRLGEKGIQTTMLERGLEWPIAPNFDGFSDQFSPDGRSTWLRTQTAAPIPPHANIDRYTGVLERMDFDGMKVYAGAGVGGGSLVYGGMTVQPERELFERIFPSEVSYDEMDSRYYPLVKEMINATIVPDRLKDSEYFKYAEVFRRQAENAGLNTRLIDQAYDWDIVLQELDGEIPHSALKGELLYGNNNGCKNSLDKNYLADARATGNVNIYTLHQVADITQRKDGIYVVEVEILDQYGNVVENRTLTCEYLFMAAGSVGTSRLLTKAKAKNLLPNLNSFVGKGWGTNGNVMFKRNGVLGQTGTVQANPPIRAMEYYDNPFTPLLIESAPYPIGAVLPIDCLCLIQLAVGLETGRGEFEYDAIRDDIRLNWPADGNKKVLDAAKHTVAKLNESNLGIEYLDNVLDPSGYTTDFTYHPCGGAVIGEATDYYGRVENYNKLYVVDGALMPGSSACANPSWTIAALAERCMADIIGDVVKL